MTLESLKYILAISCLYGMVLVILFARIGNEIFIPLFKFDLPFAINTIAGLVSIPFFILGIFYLTFSSDILIINEENV